MRISRSPETVSAEMAQGAAVPGVKLVVMMRPLTLSNARVYWLPAGSVRVRLPLTLSKSTSAGQAAQPRLI